MRHLTFFCVAITIVALTANRGAGQLDAIKLGRPSDALGDLKAARYTGPTENFLQEHLRQTAEQSFANENLMRYSERFLGLERYQATGFELAMEGAGAGATLGLFAGAVANTSGLWDEDSSWYIMGAAAALGAFLGYKRGLDDPKKRTRYRWNLGVDASSRNR